MLVNAGNLMVNVEDTRKEQKKVIEQVLKGKQESEVFLSMKESFR